jgi:predicted RNA-binding Zn-ribbon protein involved in translation (DUF1610 family)
MLPEGMVRTGRRNWAGGHKRYPPILPAGWLPTCSTAAQPEPKDTDMVCPETCGQLEVLRLMGSKQLAEDYNSEQCTHPERHHQSAARLTASKAQVPALCGCGRNLTGKWLPDSCTVLLAGSRHTKTVHLP